MAHYLYASQGAERVPWVPSYPRPVIEGGGLVRELWARPPVCVARKDLPAHYRVGRMRVKRWAHTPAHVLNTCGIFLAGPNKGKTEIAKSMLVGALSHYPLIVNIAPTPTLGDEKDYFLDNNLHFTFEEFEDGRLLADIVRHQEIRMRSYNYLRERTARQLDRWQQLIPKIDRVHGVDLRVPALINERAKILAARAGANEHKRAAVARQYQETLQRAYGAIIMRHRGLLMATREAPFTNAERGAMLMFGMAPHVVLVFDDLAARLKKWKPLMNLWIHQRRLNIGIMILAHHFTNHLPPPIRENAKYWMVHGKEHIRRLVHEQIWPNTSMIGAALAAEDTPHQFYVFGDATDQELYVSEVEFTSNKGAYDFIGGDVAADLGDARDQSMRAGRYDTFLRVFWEAQHAHWAAEQMDEGEDILEDIVMNIGTYLSG